MIVQHTSGLRVLRRREVQERLGISRATLYGYRNPKSSQFKPDFPEPVRVGGFMEHEIDAYLSKLMAERDMQRR